MALEYNTSQMGQRLLVHEGHEFVKEKTKVDKVYWKCTQYKSYGCKARAHTSDGQVVKYDDCHNHVPLTLKIAARKAVTEMKGLSRTSTEPPRKLVASAVEKVQPAILGALPTEHAMAQAMQRARKKANYPAGVPRNVADLHIPQNYQQTNVGHPFLVYDSGPEENRILMFSHADNLRALGRAQHIFADGTFRTAPQPLFGQLYVIHADLAGRVVPLVFVLLCRKDEDTYMRMLNALKLRCPNLNPETVSTDFELASINAFSNAFPNSRHKGCWFHFGQCLWRQVQGNAEALRRYSDPEFASQVKSLGALSFVPPDNVAEVFEELCNSEFYRGNPCLHPLLKYFERNWIGKMNRLTGIRNNPLFAIELWNNRAAVFNNLHLTTNSLEGWHRALNARVGSTHPNIWQFIDHLKGEQTLVFLKLEAFFSGKPIRKEKRYVECYRRIQNAANNWGNVNNLDYLRGISHNIEFNV